MTFEEFMAGKGKQPVGNTGPLLALPQLAVQPQQVVQPVQSKKSGGLLANIGNALSSFGKFAFTSFNQMNEAKFGKPNPQTGKIDTTNSLYGKTVVPAAGMAHDVIRGTARALTEAPLTISDFLAGSTGVKSEPIQPGTGPVDKFLFGDKPMSSVQSRLPAQVATYGPLLESKGVPKGAVKPLVGGVMIAGLAFDAIIPGVDDILINGVKNLVKKGLEKVAPELATKLAEKEAIKYAEKAIAKELKNTGEKLTKEEITVQAEKLIAERSAKVTAGEVGGVTLAKTEKYASNINLNRLNISPEAKTTLQDTVKSIEENLKAVKGAPITHDEVSKLVEVVQSLKTSVPRSQTLTWEARVTKLRKEVGALAEGRGLTSDFIKKVEVLHSQLADSGRRLNILGYGADPSLNTIKEDLVAEMTKMGVSLEDMLKAGKNVDFGNPKQVSDFYRKFVKPTFLEKIDEYRYINLLSSPKTHITNMFSNLQQATIVSPLTKLFSGAIDSVGSKITTKEQQHFIAEVPAYYRGLYNSIGTSWDSAVQVFKGEKFFGRPDLARLPSGSLVSKVGGAIPRALEASDAFFQGIIKSGEKEAIIEKLAQQGKKMSEAKIDALATERAQYFVFRKAVDPTNKTDQGVALSIIDNITAGLQKFRKPWVMKDGTTIPNPIGWFVPFIQTPMNIFKQGFEYSPLGFTTLWKAGDKTEQLSKAFIGSTVMATTAWVLSQTDSTWAAPTSEADKAIFYASGRQPYSIKLGNQWVSYSRLGVLSYPMALAGSLKYYYEQDPKAIDENGWEKLGKSLGGMAKFFSDQSYVQGVGNLFKSVQGGGDFFKNASTVGTNFVQQLVPLSSLQGFVNRVIDPIYRNPSTPMEKVQSGILGLSQFLPAYTGPAGEPSERKNSLFNNLSPVGVTPNNPDYDTQFKFTQEYRQFQNIQSQINKAVKERDATKVIKLKKDNMGLLKLGNSLSGYQNSITALQNKIDTITADKLLSEEQKTKQTATLNAQIKKQQEALQLQYLKLKGKGSKGPALISPL